MNCFHPNGEGERTDKSYGAGLSWRQGFRVKTVILRNRIVKYFFVLLKTLSKANVCGCLGTREMNIKYLKGHIKSEKKVVDHKLPIDHQSSAPGACEKATIQDQR